MPSGTQLYLILCILHIAVPLSLLQEALPDHLIWDPQLPGLSPPKPCPLWVNHCLETDYSPLD